jgi:hypothetical protein
MKTTILISTLTALSLMINMNESAFGCAAENHSFPVDRISIATVTGTIMPGNKDPRTCKKTSVETTPVAGPENFDYLKFNISAYSGNNELSSTEDFDLPVNDFGYLRFDVDNFIGPIAGSPESIDLPADNFSYLKFDVNMYVNVNEQESAANTGQPLAETQF